MITFFKYIVSLILIFNIESATASNITLELANDKPSDISAEFKGALNLPHAIIFKQMLNNKNNTHSGRLFSIAYYFNEKYPEDAIENKRPE